jgi:hypothetical protein
MILLSQGRAAQALTDLKESLKEAVTPTRSFHLARVQAGLDNKQEAKKAFREAQSQGLRQAQLHPAEQAVYTELRDKLGR